MRRSDEQRPVHADPLIPHEGALTSQVFPGPPDHATCPRRTIATSWLFAMGQSYRRVRTNDGVMNRNNNTALVIIGTVVAVLLVFLIFGGNGMMTGGMMHWWR
jgi:hypothetical protein